MIINKLKDSFLNAFGGSSKDIHYYFAPGRVNLIGEHTDYNNGFVLPCALSFGTHLAIRSIKDQVIKFRSANFDDAAEIPMQKNYTRQGERWINYPLGVIQMLRQRGFPTPGLETLGLEMYFSGDIPPAAGLSSSASIEMVTAFALNDMFGWKLDITELVHLSRMAENEFVGVNCGIMDQFAVGHGKKDHAIFLNCGTLAFHHVPVRFPGYRLVIANTNKKRGLADSKYNERVAECQRALVYLSKVHEIGSLGELGMDQFLQSHYLIEDPMVMKRARHVVSENKRVLEAVKALMNSDLDNLGRLMTESHQSLRDDYEVTGYELDALVESMMDRDGVPGARMTGAGFGGCAVAFVKEECLEDFIMLAGESYFNRTRLTAEFYLPEIGDRVRTVRR